MSLASIQKEVFQLSSRERALLIDLLWESFDEASIAEIETKWASESEDRIDAFERGELHLVLVQFEIAPTRRLRVSAPRARNVKAWAGGPGGDWWKFRSAEGAK
jgi:hypothetical protein